MSATVTSRVPAHVPPLYGRVLVGTDGSATAREAVRQATRIARLTGSDLEVVYVFDPNAGLLGSGIDLRLVAEEALQEASGFAAAEHVPVSARLLAGDPAGALAREAAERYAGLICVGPDAGVSERPLPLGRVAVRTLRGAHGSVLVARPAGESAFPSRILCAVDGSTTALEAVRQAARLAGPAGAELLLLHVVPVVHGGGVGFTVQGDEEGFEPLEPAVAAALAEGVRTGREMAMGRPGPSIASVAEEFGADLIALGSRGLSTVPRVLLGSVSEWVARHASCSVLVVRP